MKPPATASLKGALLAFASALSIMAVYILSRRALTTMTASLMTGWWFLFAFGWALLAALAQRKHLARFGRQLKEHQAFFIAYCLIDAASTFLFFSLLKRMNPAVLSFFDSLTPLFVALVAAIALGERLRRREIGGGILALFGVTLLTYASPDVSPLLGGLAILSILLYAVGAVLVKRHVPAVDPRLVTGVRIIGLTCIYAAVALADGSLRLPTASELPSIMAGSLAGPVLGVFFTFSAFRFIPATRVFLIKTSQPFLVAIASAMLLGTSLTMRQLAAGVLISAGITRLIVNPSGNPRRHNSKEAPAKN